MKRILRPATVAAPVSSWLCCVVVGAIAGAAGAAAAAPSTLSSYHVGNSLTWDSSPNMVAAMAAQRGHAQTVGYHIACGQSLTSITGGDPWTCVPTNSFGMYDTALPQNAWDAITAEPYTGSTLGGEAAAFAQLMQLSAPL